MEIRTYVCLKSLRMNALGFVPKNDKGRSPRVTGSPYLLDAQLRQSWQKVFRCRKKIGIHFPEYC